MSPVAELLRVQVTSPLAVAEKKVQPNRRMAAHAFLRMSLLAFGRLCELVFSIILVS